MATDADVRAMFHPPAWVTGGLSTEDAVFLVDLVEATAPTSVIELGVAAGTSSAALLYALDQLGGARLLVSVDTQPTCYFDPTRAIGAAVAEMYPAPRTVWIVQASGLGIRADDLAPFDLALIDADHRHPAPLLDVLELAPQLRPGAWIALHDIALARTQPKFQSHGAEWLFDAWPFAKSFGAPAAPNIGAIQLPVDLAALLPVARTLLHKRWEDPRPGGGRHLALVFQDVTTIIGVRRMHSC